MNAEQRTALITGASRGLGLALARGLAAAGWALVIDARGGDALEAARAELAGYTTVRALAGDVTDPAHRRALAEAARELGGLDALVNNAGILGPSPLPSLLDFPLDALEEIFRANVVAPLGVLQALRDDLKPGACIVSITSDAGVEAYPGWGGYGAGKAALEQLSHVLAAERPDLRVHWVDPGDMRTAMHQLAFPGEDISDRPLPEDSVPGLIALLEGDFPSGRYQAKAAPLAGVWVQGSRRSVSPVETVSEGGIGDRRSTDEAVDTEATTAQEPGVRELRVALTVEDFARAVALYRDGLALPVVKEWGDNNGRGVVLAAGRATLELLDRADAEHTDAVEAGRRVSGPVRLALEVPDVERMAASLEAHGAAALHEPVHTTWGNFTQRVQTPDGMQLSLYTPDDEEA